ncbi:hypothetical protein JTB14_030974 [Gonioctena quinquepunctata]|nr:hypothetical protein JTB14_030974 [Gonioctena quinquepunctata]
MLMATGTHQENECRISNRTISCKGIQQEDFIYQLFKNEDDFQNTYVTTVEIVDSNYSFIEAFPDPARYFQCEIQTLKIRSSSIRRIDKNAFKDLEGLTLLDLGRNHIEDISFLESINSDLRSLNLEDNRIQILDLNIFSAKRYLDTVIMRANNISEITASHNQLKEITSVDLSFNRISAFNESDLNCFFSSIDLSYNELENITILDVRYYTTLPKVVVNLAGNDLASLRASGKNSLSCKELYLTSVPTEIPDELIISGIFSLANTKIREWNKDVFNISVVSKRWSDLLTIDFSNSSITEFSESYFENVETSVLNLSHNDFTVMNKNIFNKSIVTHLDLSFSNISSLPNDSFRGLEKNLMETIWKSSKTF